MTLARVLKPQGRRGEVAVEVLTDFPERFAERRRLFALQPDGARRELALENFWEHHKDRLILKFSGVETINDAEALVGCEIQVPREQRVPLEAGAKYLDELIGCELVAGGRTVGVVDDIQFGAGEAPLLVLHEGKRELLIPLAQQYIRTLDVAAKRIHMELPEGMLELDAPLSAEEKELQRKKTGC
ncbi:MAG: ribosome maturation factor RimM [Terriglobales bacterium]